jgi:energy-coupling factor transporter ATP-binding protein EcfA2
MTTVTTPQLNRLMLPDRVSGLPLLPADYSPGEWASLPIGRGYGRKALLRGFGHGRKIINLDLASNAHTLVMGPCGSGKTVLMRQIILSALNHGHNVTVIEPMRRGGDYRVFEPWLTDLVTDRSAAVGSLLALDAEVTRRIQMLHDHGVNRWDELPQSERVRPITVVVDEFAYLVHYQRVPRSLDADDEYALEVRQHNAEAERAAFLVKKIVHRARFAGVHLVIATQRMDYATMTSEVRSCFGNVIQMLRPDHAPSDTALSMAFHGMADLADIRSAIRLLGTTETRGAAVMVSENGGIRTLRVAYTHPGEITAALKDRLPANSAEDKPVFTW